MTQDQAREANRAALRSATANKAAERSAEMSVMGPDILVTGNIEATVDLLIEGRVVGDVRCMTLVLGEGSSVTGSIHAERVRVSGKVDGAIETRDLAIEASAVVKGDVTYSRIRIANGGVIEGQLKHVAAPAEDEAPEPEAKLKLVEPAGDEPKALYYE